MDLVVLVVLVVLGAVALGIAMLVLAPVASTVVAAPILFVIGMASILYMTATTAIAQVEAKQEMHGRVMALQTVLIGGPMAVGGPIRGWLADTFGGRAPIILGGVAALIAAALGWWADRRYVTAPRAG